MEKLLSLIILTKDEELNLPHCLNSVKKLDPAIFVVDSGSTDRTLEIAKSFGAKVFSHPFEYHAKQLNWAIDDLPIKTPWCMRMDADETLTEELVNELLTQLPQTPGKITGMLIKLRVKFWGRWIRHGGYYSTWLLRIWRTGLANYEDRRMDEHLILRQGSAMQLKNDIVDENHKGLSFWIEKHNRYSDQELLSLAALESTERNKLAAPMRRRRWWKENIYLRAPLFLRSFLYWFFRYFILLGFLDGIPGLVFHFLQGFWYRFLVDAKLYEARLRSKENDRPPE